MYRRYSMSLIFKVTKTEKCEMTKLDMAIVVTHAAHALKLGKKRSENRHTRNQFLETNASFGISLVQISSRHPRMEIQHFSLSDKTTACPSPPEETLVRFHALPSIHQWVHWILQFHLQVFLSVHADNDGLSCLEQPFFMISWQKKWLERIMLNTCLYVYNWKGVCFPEGCVCVFVTLFLALQIRMSMSKKYCKQYLLYIYFVAPSILFWTPCLAWHQCTALPVSCKGNAWHRRAARGHSNPQRVWLEESPDFLWTICPSECLLRTDKQSCQWRHRLSALQVCLHRAQTQLCAAVWP